MGRELASSHWACIVFALASWLLAAREVGAQAPAAGADTAARAAARQLAQEGIDAYLAQKYADADDKLEKGYQLFATPTLGLWSARARMQLGRWVDAAERYRETLTLSDSVGNRAAQSEALKDAKNELEALLPRIPTLTLQLDGAKPDAVKLTLDGAALSSAFIGVPRPTNPGGHELVVLHAGERTVMQVQLAERERKVLPLHLGAPQARTAGSLAAAPPPQQALAAAASSSASPAGEAPSPEAVATAATAELRSDPPSSPAAEPSKLPLQPLGIAALALGGVGLIVATSTYVVAVGTCPDATCHTKANQSKYDTLQGVSTWTFWPGALLAAGGVASLWLGASAAAKPEHARLEVGPGSVAVRGAF